MIYSHLSSSPYLSSVGAGTNASVESSQGSVSLRFYYNCHRSKLAFKLWVENRSGMVNWTLIKADDNYLNVLYRHSPAEKSGKTVKFSLRRSKDLSRIPRIKLQKSKVLPPFWIWYSWSSLYIILRYITFTVDSLLFNNLQIFYLFSPSSLRFCNGIERPVLRRYLSLIDCTRWFQHPLR